MLTVGSLFSGIGGIDLGLERAGMKVRWQVEIDPWCQRVLAKHWPDVERFADVREVGAHNLERVDLIAGGFPCQDISQAGRGAGIKVGTRSGLWYEYARIIRELRPRYVLVENVPMLLARGLDVVLADLAESGYDAEWDCIPAAAVGAPHRRDRVWLLAYPHGRGHIHGQTQEFSAEAGVDALGQSFSGGEDVAHTIGGELQRRGRFGELAGASRAEQGEGHQREWDGDSALDRCTDVADSDRGRLEIGAERNGHPFRPQQSAPFGHDPDGRGRSDWWATEPDVGRVAHGIPARVDRLRGLGNAVVPQVVEWIGRRIVEAEEVAA